MTARMTTLMTSGADPDTELAALATMPLPELRAKWSGLNKTPAPSLPAPLLRRLLAQQIQERHHGGLAPRTRRALERASDGKDARGDASSRPGSSGPAPGTRLIRDWNGKTIAVEVREGCYVWEDRTYRSLSQIAREVTGARWSGPRFFGLRRGDG